MVMELNVLCMEGDLFWEKKVLMMRRVIDDYVIGIFRDM